ncbi:MAG: glycosyltransferase family 39 protein [Planctomycetota bacterium]
MGHDWIRFWVRFWVRVRVYLIPIVLLGCLTLPHLDQGDWRTDTGRYAGVGLQAWQDGELLTLRTHAEATYFKKPPLAIVAHGWVLYAFGGEVHVDDLSLARLPTVLVAMGAVGALVWSMRAFHGRNASMLGGVVLATTYEYFRRTREISLDMWQLMFMLIALGLLARAVGGRGVVRSLLAGALVGLALLTKPLVGLVALVLCAAWLLAIGRVRRLWIVALALGAALLVATPWHALMHVRYPDTFLGEYFGAEVVDRAAGQIASRPWWYYLEQLGRTHWPWLLFAAGGLVWLAVKGRLGRSRAGPLLAAVWSGGWLVLISVFPDKAPRYALPVYAGLAWIAGVFLAAGPLQGARSIGRRLTLPLTGAAVVGAVVFALLPVRVQAPPDPGWEAAFGEIAARPGAAVYVERVNTNEQGRFVLRGLAWPAEVGGSPPEIGSLVLRTDEEELPGRERVLVAEGRVLLSEVIRE